MERYRVAEILELGDETPSSAGGVLATDEVIVAEMLEDLAGAEEMPDELDQRVRDGDGGFVGPPAELSGDLVVLEVKSTGSADRNDPQR